MTVRRFKSGPATISHGKNASNPHELPEFLLLPGEDGAEKARVKRIASILPSSRSSAAPPMVYGQCAALSRALYAGAKVLFCPAMTLGS
ncbi:MAG TPA: hypothetical protein VK552_23585 [Reyranella sp.]|nr:hypothetical protein [Reyranella sp.]